MTRVLWSHLYCCVTELYGCVGFVYVLALAIIIYLAQSLSLAVMSCTISKPCIELHSVLFSNVICVICNLLLYISRMH